VEKHPGGRSPPTTVNSSVRTREYLTTAEIERLMAAARKSSRYGHRDATMILIGYRHGLRASELCDLQWSQVELATGRLHVRRAKNGSPSVHPMQGNEIRALRRLQREQGPSSHVFMSERDWPIVQTKKNSDEYKAIAWVPEIQLCVRLALSSMSCPSLLLGRSSARSTCQIKMGQPWIDLNFCELAVGKAAGRASAAGRFAQRPGV
jgi:integrase